MKIVDLTVTVHDGLQSHPSHPRTVFMDYVTHAFSAPRYIPPCAGFASKLLVMSDHCGTHVDAPFHFHPGGDTMEKTLPEQLIGPAVALDVADEVGEEGITAELLESAVSRRGIDIKRGDIVLLRSWKGAWGDQGFHAAKGLGLSGAKWLVEGKGVKALGTDTSILEKDNSDMGRPVHLYVLGKNIPIIENLVNLDRLGNARFFFIGLPLKLEGTTGSPVRAVAVTEF